MGVDAMEIIDRRSPYSFKIELTSSGMNFLSSRLSNVTRWLDDTEMRFWRAFLVSSHRVLDAVSADLRSESGLTMDDYEVLVHLSEAPDRAVRMSELSELVVQSRSRLTQRIDRLVERGWVCRAPCPDDRRGQFAVLTDEGFDALAAAAPGHVDSVRRHLIDRIDREHLEVAAEMFDELAD